LWQPPPHFARLNGKDSARSVWDAPRDAAKSAAFSQENQLPTIAEWGDALDSTPPSRPCAIAFFSRAAAKDFANLLIAAEVEAERKALEAEIADEERIRAAAGGRSTVDAK
jgi:hypothetical protein